MTAIATIPKKEQDEIIRTAGSAMKLAESIRVTTPELYIKAASALKEVKAGQKIIKGKKDAIVLPIKAGLKALTEFFVGPEAQLDRAELLLKREMNDFDEREEDRRREAQRKAEAEAAKERARLADLAAAAEQKAREKAEADRVAAEVARAAGDDRKAEKLETRAAVTESRGLDRAQVLALAAQSMVSHMVPTEAPKVSGISRRDNWTAVVEDLGKLVAAVAAGTVPLRALQPDMAFLNKQAKALQQDLSYPGVRPHKERVLGAGSK